VSVGEALAEARGAAGLSVDEVSERTAIREIVIRSIERDDFDSLGGDLYVRGYLRKIAGAVGIDARPLIREFDATRSNGSGGWSTLGTARATVADPPVAADSPAGVDSVAGLDSLAGAGSAAGVDSAEPAAESVPGSESVPDSESTPGPVADEASVAEGSVAAQGSAALEEPLATDEPGLEVSAESIDWSYTEGDAWDEETESQPETESRPVADEATADSAFAAFTARLDGSDESAALAGPVASAESLASGASAGLASSDSSEQSWSEQGWTEPVAAESVWADPVSPESADVSAGPEAERPTVISSAASAPTTSPARRSTPVPQAVPATRRPKRPRTRVRGWGWVLTISGLTVAVLAIVGVAAGEIISQVGTTKTASAAAAHTSAPAVAPATTPPVTPSAVASTPASTPTPTPTPTVRPPAPVQRLSVKADGAFGPDGLADGDNPQSASYAITSDASAPWQTNWYATADFGLLKHGTGLLLDMGKPVTITSVTIQLGSDWGASLQLRAGNQAEFSDMPVVASATDTGGQLTLRLKKPARARYVLIWFVKLPPSGTGTYTGSVYSVTVKGRP